MNKSLIKIKKILNNNYPIEIPFDKINTLSHFYIRCNNWNKFLPFNINIDGLILNGNYKDYKIIKVITNKMLDWNKYILLCVSLYNINYNPCVNINKFMCFLHIDNYLDILKIKKMIIKKNDDIIEYKINYLDNHKTYNLIWSSNIISNIINKNNHFYFESFDVYTNYKKLGADIDRLIQNRDKYKNIHFHLDNNGGGDIVPAHIILRCLCGKKEKWMKNIKKILSNKEIFEWNCWEEENSPNYKDVQKLNLDNLPNYDTKYKGKIHLHMNKQNASSAWFFITYLIYAFSNKINRYSKKCYGQTIKYGTIESNQLILLGHSATTSGDGNSITKKYNNIEIFCPTEQFISCSIKKNDWNRFWKE